MLAGLGRQDLLDAVDCALDAGRPRVAGLLLDACATLRHDRSGVAARRARAALQAGLAEEACVIIDAELAVSEPADGLLLWRARACLALGDRKSAIRDAHGAIVHDPASAEAAGLCATLLMEDGCSGQAACVLDRAIIAGATDPALHVTLAVVLLSMGEGPAAGMALERGLLAYPGDRNLRRLQHRTAMP